MHTLSTHPAPPSLPAHALSQKPLLNQLFYFRAEKHENLQTIAFAVDSDEIERNDGTISRDGKNRFVAIIARYSPN